MIEQKPALSPALLFRDVSSGYRGREVLHGVSFTVEEGEFVSLIGPNGCGKSTLLKTAASLIRPSAGSVWVFGSDIRHLRHAERASLVGVVPQKLESPMSFRVGELVMNGRISAMGLFGRPGPDDEDIVERAMIYTDVLSLRDRYFMELSGGEQQRVALAMVLAQEPRIIMLDESIAHLDINHRQEVLQILMNLNRERRITVVLVSHDLTLSAQISDRLLLLHDGRLAAEGTPGEVLRPELLSRIYNCELQVRKDPWSGELQVSGDLSLVRRRKALGKRVHVIAGGGSGIELYRRLLLEGYEVSTGVLNRLDSDAEAARALHLDMALEQPFSAVSEASCREASLLVSAADALVVTEVPFGSGNLINLSLAVDALREGKPVFLAAGIAGRDYTEGRAAERKAAGLKAGGACTWSSVHELIPLLQQSLR
ncbi:MAG: ATP-binding cassette domain-containing protein [Chlorobium sp.]|jgi:iron complex transport system ATP-binding protein|uniref:ABC transporter ATP-binding protein n=1 Tax=Chlorobium sp. TaxID=1095 RepID=UPI0025C1B332|nr:ATP-binding cassette domain-containing protein [Chlorobium sp.]MCF8215864.1 ATP-binding cassette domain-containing protein [Chlorobium sp.]MCF8270762.1 ATP-binding cassette domain-containing protein [Chlorobium sp.]MCF8287074.1 ATP-binding cassette domain-containing protein [Chlorobium sp.]MCF8290731.1 ATP-binding cassette domain-containing protein [Chlorobium sp.]MCF8384835.1 ATP-binding cassette domain-containing protein [Chlorobium sp.]